MLGKKQSNQKQLTEQPGRMSDLPSLQVFINRLDEHLSEICTLPGRPKDTGERSFGEEGIHTLISQWIKYQFEG